MRSPSSSSEEEGDDELCWLEGGWPEVHLLGAPPCTAPETSLETPHAGFDVDKLPIGEAEALFFDNQEDLWQACTESTYEESEDSGEDDYIDEENDWALEEMLLPPKMLHSVHSLRPRKWRRHSDEGGDVQQGTSAGVDVERGGVHATCGSKEPLSPPLFAPNVPAHVRMSPGNGAGHGVHSGDGWVGA
jgi:hypothetical protein